MIKIKTQQRQINSITVADMVPCPHNKMRSTNVVACQGSCRRFAGIESGFLFCGHVGANKPFQSTLAMRPPSLWEVFGEGERNWLVGAYGKPL